MRLNFRPGLHADFATLAPADDLRWRFSDNVRWRRIGTNDVAMETIGATSVLRNGANPPVPVTVVADVWTLFPYTDAGASKLICAGINALHRLSHGANSTFIAPKIAIDAIQTFSGGSALSLSTPANPGVTPIQPFWWFVENGDRIVGGRAGAAFAPMSWNKNISNNFTAIANAPTGAVGGAIEGGKLLLLGPGLSFAWSDQFDFTSWTPGDATQAGSNALDRGSRIIAGGATAYGIVAWTETAMALITEVPDLSIVFGYKYVDGAAGICGNRAWCEAGGRVWWLNGNRVLHVYDGGTPVQIPCPIADTTLWARLGAVENSWFVLTPYAAMEEIWISYRIGTTGLSRTLVYNYGLDCWYPLRHFDTSGGYFTAFASGWSGYNMISAARVLPGNIEFNVHDAPVEQPVEYEIFESDTIGMTDDAFRRFRFTLTSARFVLDENPPSQTLQTGHLLVDARVSPPDGNLYGDSAQFNIILRGLRDAAPINSAQMEETRRWKSTETVFDYRVDGRALEMTMQTDVIPGWDDANVWNNSNIWVESTDYAIGRFRWGAIWLEAVTGGER